MSEETKNQEENIESEVESQEEVSEEEKEEKDPLDLLKEENENLKNECKRILADSDNYRKRLLQQQDEFQKMAMKGIIEKLLPVVDNLERSIQAAQESDNIASLKEGVEMILMQFETILEDVGLTKIDIKAGDEFDPQICEALMMEEVEEGEYSMTVTDVFETGRILNGHVLRTSKVKVAKKKS